MFRKIPEYHYTTKITSNVTEM